MCVCVSGRCLHQDRVTESERERERDRDRDRDRERERKREREREREKQGDRHRDKEMQRDAEKDRQRANPHTNLTSHASTGTGGKEARECLDVRRALAITQKSTEIFN